MPRDVKAELDQLRAEFRSRLPAQLEELAAIARGRDSKLEPLRAAVHRLRGTSGSYGARDVAELLGHIERAFESDAPDRWTTIDSLVTTAIEIARRPQ